VRYWASRGKTHWEHNAQSVTPFFGNPTSALVYDHLNASSLDVQGVKRWRNGAFARALGGAGTIRSGNLNDSDFFVGQVKFSETNSSVSSRDLSYAVIDGGYEFLRPRPRTSLGVFGGYSYWNERIDASGASFVVPAGAAGAPNTVKVITNDMEWHSLRAGIDARAQIGEKLLVTGSFAAVPVAWLRNDDSHLLRSDLGPTPNIKMDGRGRGVQLEAEMRYQLFKAAEIGFGVRYWKLRVTDGNIHFAGGDALPLNLFESERYGATLNLVTRW
jgi:hypothetical protein